MSQGTLSLVPAIPSRLTWRGKTRKSDKSPCGKGDFLLGWIFCFPCKAALITPRSFCRPRGCAYQRWSLRRWSCRPPSSCSWWKKAGLRALRFVASRGFEPENRPKGPFHSGKAWAVLHLGDPVGRRLCVLLWRLATLPQETHRNDPPAKFLSGLVKSQKQICRSDVHVDLGYSFGHLFRRKCDLSFDIYHD